MNIYTDFSRFYYIIKTILNLSAQVYQWNDFIQKWFARQQPERHSNESLDLSGYIRLGASIPSKFKAFSIVILKEETRHKRDFSRSLSS